MILANHAAITHRAQLAHRNTLVMHVRRKRNENSAPLVPAHHGKRASSNNHVHKHRRLGNAADNLRSIGALHLNNAAFKKRGNNAPRTTCACCSSSCLQY